MHDDKNKKLINVLKASSHTIVWQFLASVTIPAFIINRIVKLAKIVVQKRTSNKQRIKWIPTFIGLAAIPIMPYLVDPLVDNLLEKVFALNTTEKIK